MDIFRGSWANFNDSRDSIVTVGSFDGLHIGHRVLIDRITELARAQNRRSVVVTFDTHPRHVVRDERGPVPLLTTSDEKLDLLAQTGVDLAMLIHFDQGVAEMSPEDFVQMILCGRIGMKKIVIGYNHAFGKARRGDRESLIAMSRDMGFSVDVVNPVRVGDRIISSTYLRGLIREGQVAKAAEGLGRYYSIRGVVVRGFGRGKRLHWPTANLGLIKPDKLAPKDGIYAGVATIRGAAKPAAVSIGYNPTFAEGKHSLEAHLIQFDAEIYDEEIEVGFVERIRSEMKFSSEEDLSQQIGEDVKRAERLLSERGLVKTLS